MPSRVLIAYVLIALMAAFVAAGIVHYLRKRREQGRIMRGHGHHRRHRR